MKELNRSDLCMSIGQPCQNSLDELATSTTEPEIVDLQITDIKYAQALAEGRNPLQEKAFERTLICAGIDPSDARRVAPLIAKEVRSPEQQAVVKAVWFKWCALLSRSAQQ